MTHSNQDYKNNKLINSGKILAAKGGNSSQLGTKFGVPHNSNKDNSVGRKSAVRISYGTDAMDSYKSTIREEQSSEIRSDIDMGSKQLSNRKRSASGKKAGIKFEASRGQSADEDSYAFLKPHGGQEREKSRAHEGYNKDGVKLVNNFMVDSKGDDSISYSISHANPKGKSLVKI